MKTMRTLPIIIFIGIIINLFKFTLSFDNSQIISILFDSSMRMREMGLELMKKNKTKEKDCEKLINENNLNNENNENSFPIQEDCPGQIIIPPIQQYNNVTIDNQTYSIHPAGNSTDCIPECYLNCQVHFPASLELKYCLLNVCHCTLIEEGRSPEIISPIDNTNPGLERPTLLPPNTVISLNQFIEKPTEGTESTESPYIASKIIPKYKFDEHTERRNYYILMLLLFLIIIPLMVYYTIQLIKYWDKSEELGYEFPYAINDYMLIGEYNPQQS